MKKILSLVLILAMVLGMLAACGEDPTNPTQPGATLEDAQAYLAAFYKEDEGTVARRDFSLIAVVMIDGVSFPITWTTDSPDYVTLGAVENNTVKVDIVEEPAEQVTFKLTGTLTDAEGKTASVTVTRVIEAKKVTGVEFVAAPVAGTAYKYAVQQNNLGQTIYFTGEMSGYYLATSPNPFDAVDVFVEDVDGGQRIFFTSAEGVKTYIDVVPRGADQPGKVNVILTEAPAAVFTWDAERKTFVTTVEGNNWYIGCYNTYNTMSASNTSYIEKVEVIGDTQFPSGFCTVNIVASQVAAPAVDTAYKFTVVQNNLGQTLYFTGSMSGYYLATSVNPAEGVNVFVENAEGGVRLYFMKGETKTYIDVVPRGADQPGKVNVILTEEPTAVFTWDAERRTYTTEVEGNTWYLGCYNTYNTISASNISYIEKVEVIGDTQFPAGPYTVEGFMEMQPEFNDEPVVEPTEPTTAPTTAPTEPSEPATEPSEPSTEPSEPATEPTEPAEPAYDPSVLAAQLVEAAKLANGEYLDVISTIVGTIVDDPVPSSRTEGQYKFTVTDGTNTVYCYYVPVTGGVPQKGDAITVTGKLSAYNGAPQFEEKQSTATLGGAATEDPTEPSEPATEPTEPTEPAEPAEQKIVITQSGKYVTGTDYLYTSSSGNQKHELALTSNIADALQLVVRDNGDGTVTFVTNEGKFLMADGTHVQIVDAEGDNTKFILEEVNGGYYIKCANATYQGKPQYLEIYRDYLTCYGMGSDTSIYTFQLEEVE